jgi:hypothetical protein
VLVAAALALLLCGGGSFASSQGLRSWAMNLVIPSHNSDTPPSNNVSNGSRSPEDAQLQNRPSGLDWSLETEHDGARRTLSADEDFSAEGSHTFKTRDAFHEGDRLRLVASTHPAKMIYVFYVNGSEAKRLAADDAGKVTVPSESDEWFKLDSHPGTEQFVIVASNEHQRKLDDMTGNSLGADALDKQFRDLSGRKDVALTRVLVRHE